MRYYIIFIFFLLLIQNVLAQEKSDRKNYPVLYLGYSNQEFLNSNYSNLKNQGYLGAGNAFTGGVRFRFLSYLSFDLGGFYGGHEVKKNTPAWAFSDVKVNTSGMESSLSLLLMTHKIKWFKPYIGGGYQSSNIAVTKNSSSGSSNSNQKNTTLSKMDTSGAFWNFKLFIKISAIELAGEYRQTFGEASMRHLQFTLNCPLHILR